MKLPKYENKPFKPPRRVTEVKVSGSASASVGLAVKRAASSRASPISIKKTKVSLPTDKGSESDDSFNRKFYTMMYRKPTLKKHKTWGGDGYAILKSWNKFTFYDGSGKFLGISIYNGDTEVIFDNIFKAGSLEIQLDYEIIDLEEQHEAKLILGQTKDQTDSMSSRTDRATSITTSAHHVVSSATRLSPLPVSQLFEKKTVTKFRSNIIRSKAHTSLSVKDQCNEISDSLNKYLPVFDVSKIEYPIVMNKTADAEVDVIVDPLLGKCLRPHQRQGVKFMYDCVLGLARPAESSGMEDLAMDLTSKSLILEHDSDIQGCLLADEMGLGKTLTTIALIWTLLKQTPMASRVPCSQSGVPLQGLCNKVLIVCPVTLIANWKREIGHWLNLTRIGVLTLSSHNTSERDKYDVRNFLKVQKTYQVLIVGYEKLLTISEELMTGKDSIDLLVCDEGHRLKNGASKILNILKSLDIDKKVLLSGTPIQNDLNEFYTIADFINPGVLGSFSHFKNRYMNPITRARDPSNRLNQIVVAKGEERSKEMIDITRRFILRRTNSILEAYLPPKMDMIIFCRPTDVQVSAFKDILRGAQIDFNNMSFNSSLALITLFKKVCNSPTLIKSDPYYKSKLNNTKITAKYDRALNSGKLKVLMALLERIKNGTDGEKVVVISNYTQTLDIIESLMGSADMKICRLDGSTQSKQRDTIVTSFNRDPSIFAFLLSAKSGGVGLNLTGASRLILFDNDWNPSVDLQAMSRIHRDGQKRPCFIYRLVTTGCIDEKILQRQLMKHSLSRKFLCDSTAAEGHADDDLFNKEDLKDLFSVLVDTNSNTHDLICSCDGQGEEVVLGDEVLGEQLEKKRQEVSQLSSWQSALDIQRVIEAHDSDDKKAEAGLIKRCLVGYRHIHPKTRHDLFDGVATEAIQRLPNDVSFVLVNPGKTHRKATD